VSSASPETPAPDADAAVEAAALAALDRGARREAFALLLRAYGPRLRRLCHAMIRDAALAEDVHQTVFLEAWRDLPRFARRAPLRSWLTGICRHRCLDALKAERRRRKYVEPEARDAADPVAGADVRLADAEASPVLDGCVKRLAPEVRMALLLRYQEGLAYDEIARIARERAGTLQMRVSRALVALRDCLKSHGVTG
jgi:RNA polymerase sigma-70 factor (ECF subfamily)